MPVYRLGVGSSVESWAKQSTTLPKAGLKVCLLAHTLHVIFSCVLRPALIVRATTQRRTCEPENHAVHLRQRRDFMDASLLSFLLFLRSFVISFARASLHLQTARGQPPRGHPSARTSKFRAKQECRGQQCYRPTPYHPTGHCRWQLFRSCASV